MGMWWLPVLAGCILLFIGSLISILVFHTFEDTKYRNISAVFGVVFGIVIAVLFIMKFA